MSYSEIAIAIATTITAIATVGTLYYLKKDREPSFIFEKFPENDIWFIRILYPDKLIKRCSITLDGKQLSLARLRDTFECSIIINGGENFIINKGSWNQDSE